MRFVPPILAYGARITGADVDAFFNNLVTVINGNLEAANFAPDAGIQLVNRATQGNRHVICGSWITQAVNDGVDLLAGTSPILLDVGEAAEVLGVPAVMRVVEIGMTIRAYTNYAAGDTATLMYRLYDTRVGAWSAWTTTGIATPNAGVAGITTAIKPVIGDKDNSRMQLCVQYHNAAGGGAMTADGTTVWVVVEALHLP